VKDSLYDNFKQYTRTIAKSYSKGYRANFILCTIKTQFEFLMAPSQAKLDLNSSTVSPRRMRSISLLGTYIVAWMNIVLSVPLFWPEKPKENRNNSWQS
jgi:hypothetical protein